MAKIGNVSDLYSTSIDEYEKFVSSPLDEIEYFECDSNDIITLKEYLLELKKQKSEYYKLIRDYLSSIKEKNPWCIDVQPINSEFFIMEATTKNYPSVFIRENEGALSIGSLAYDSGSILGPLYSRRYYARKKIIENSRAELLEIEKIIKSFGFDNKPNGLITKSNRFLVTPYNFDEVYVQKKPTLCLKHKIKTDDEISGNFSDSLVKKLYLKK